MSPAHVATKIPQITALNAENPPPTTGFIQSFLQTSNVATATVGRHSCINMAICEVACSVVAVA